MDAFYASVEQRDFPELRGKPVAVGGSAKRGVVAAASYEARSYGVYSAMPSVLAKRKCPDLLFVKPRFEVYRAVSAEIRDIFYEYTDLVEPLSLDEAYLDVTENKKQIPSATLIAKAIKTEIKARTGLNASAGISINKFLAKIASDYDKPNGLYLIPPEKAAYFVENLPIERFFGIGKVTAEKMKKLGISKGADLKKWDKHKLIQTFGKTGLYYYNIARAIDNRPVNPDRHRKSIGTERTFAEDLSGKVAILAALEPIAEKLTASMQKSRSFGRTLTLKVKFQDFQQITRSKTLPHNIRDLETLQHTYKTLVEDYDWAHKKIRLLGLQISNLQDKTQTALQLELCF